MFGITIQYIGITTTSYQYQRIIPFGIQKTLYTNLDTSRYLLATFPHNTKQTNDKQFFYGII